MNRRLKFDNEFVDLGAKEHLEDELCELNGAIKNSIERLARNGFEVIGGYQKRGLDKYINEQMHKLRGSGLPPSMINEGIERWESLRESCSSDYNFLGDVTNDKRYVINPITTQIDVDKTVKEMRDRYVTPLDTDKLQRLGDALADMFDSYVRFCDIVKTETNVDLRSGGQLFARNSHGGSGCVGVREIVGGLIDNNDESLTGWILSLFNIYCKSDEIE